MTGQTLNFSPELKQTRTSLNEEEQAVFVVFNMEIREIILKPASLSKRGKV